MIRRYKSHCGIFDICLRQSICADALDMRCGASGDLYRTCCQKATYRIPTGYIDFVKQKYRVLQSKTYRQKEGSEMEKNQLREDCINLAIAVSDICDDIKGCTVFINQLVQA